MLKSMISALCRHSYSHPQPSCSDTLTDVRVKAHGFEDNGWRNIRSRENPSTCCSRSNVDPPLYAENALSMTPHHRHEAKTKSAPSCRNKDLPHCHKAPIGCPQGCKKLAFSASCVSSALQIKHRVQGLQAANKTLGSTIGLSSISRVQDG